MHKHKVGPQPWNCSRIIRPADWLIETSRMTAATPMTIPSTVRPARASCSSPGLEKPRRTVSKRFMNVSQSMVVDRPLRSMCLHGPVTTNWPSCNLPDTTSVNFSPSKPVAIFTADSKSPSTIQTYRCLWSDGWRRIVVVAVAAASAESASWLFLAVGALPSRIGRSQARTWSGFGIEPQRGVGDLQDLAHVSRSETIGWPSSLAAI